ncbi:MULTISPECIES: hypothetical protein [unclassified Wolbachia]
MNFVSGHQIFQLLCNKAIPVSSTGMTAVLRHTAAVSQPLTSSGMTVVV